MQIDASHGSAAHGDPGYLLHKEFAYLSAYDRPNRPGWDRRERYESMGKLKGFIEIDRQKHPARAVEERLRDWQEVYLPYPTSARVAR